MSLISVKQASDLLGVSRQRANDFCKRGDLVKTGKKIDLNDARNLSFLHARGVTSEAVAAVLAGGVPPTVPEPAQPKPPNTKKKPAAAPPQDLPDDLIGDIDAEAILERLSSLDIRRLTNADVQKVQRLEAALKTRVEREHKRGQLIKRDAVATVFGRLYTIDTNELRTLGAKLAHDVAGLFEVEDPAKILLVEKRIDDEVLKSLAHIKRVLDDFLVKAGAEPVQAGA